VVAFLRLYASEILGKFANRTVGKSGLLRSPYYVPVECNFATAVVGLAECKFSSIPVVDSSNRMCGRVDSECMKLFWWHWKLNTARRSGVNYTLEQIRHEYLRGHEKISTGFGLNFSHFSMLLSPINQCEHFGIKITDYEKYFRAARLAFEGKGTKNIDAISEESDSDEDDDVFDDTKSRTDALTDDEDDTKSLISSSSRRSVSFRRASSTKGIKANKAAALASKKY
jgi:hypothetical protein